MKSPDEMALAAELRALRPTPRSEFSAELDARAAAGFPRQGGGASGARGAFARAADRLRISPRRLWAPAGGLAVASILVATVIVLSDDGGADRDAMQRFSDSGGAASSAPGHPGSLHTFSAKPSAGSNNAYRPGTTELIPAPQASAGASAAAEAMASDEAQAADSLAAKPASGPYASHARQRDVERSAELVLGTDPADVRRAAGKVFGTVHAYDGIVLESSISDGGEGEASASFELLIPSGKVGDALASFSRIAEVRSRQEETADITARTIGVGERLQDSRARIEGLLAQLVAADTDAERAAAEAQLREERYRAAALRAHRADLQRRTNLSHVSLKIVSSAEGAAPAAEDSSWGIGDALGDAGHILEVAAGVTLIALAVLAPFALLITLALLTRRGTLRRSRERTLG